MDMSGYDEAIEFLEREVAREEQERERRKQQAAAGDQNAVDIDGTGQGEITGQITDADQFDQDFPQPVHAVEIDETPAEKKGKPGRKPSGKQKKDCRVTLLFSEMLWRDLQDLAHAAGRTPNSLVNNLVLDTVERNRETINQYRRLNQQVNI